MRFIPKYYLFDIILINIICFPILAFGIFKSQQTLFILGYDPDPIDGKRVQKTIKNLYNSRDRFYEKTFKNQLMNFEWIKDIFRKTYLSTNKTINKINRCSNSL